MEKIDKICVKEIVPTFDGTVYTLEMYQWELDAAKLAMDEYNETHKDEPRKYGLPVVRISKAIQIAPRNRPERRF